MKFNKILWSSLAGIAFATGSGTASAVYLPAANAMSTVTYGDFQVYALDLLEKCAAANDSRCLPSGPLPIDANAGWTKGQLQVFTGENGQDQTTNTPNPLVLANVADNPYASPAGNQGATLFFGSAFSPEPAPSFAGDRTGFWDITIGALRSYLGTHDLVFIFDNDQQGNAQNQWLQIWGQAQIVDTNGTEKACFQLNGTASPGCAPRVDPTDAFTPGSYVTAFTGYCVDKVTGAAFDLGLGSLNYCAGKNAYFIDGNKGSANADNAAFSKALHDFIFAATTDERWLLSLDIRTANNNGGAETLWICSNCDIDEGKVPEPGSMALIGLGLMGMAALRRRRQRA